MLIRLLSIMKLRVQFLNEKARQWKGDLSSVKEVTNGMVDLPSALKVGISEKGPCTRTRNKTKKKWGSLQRRWLRSWIRMKGL